METNNILAHGNIPSGQEKAANDEKIPIMASSVVIDIKELILDKNGNADYSSFEKALDNFKECGFHGFIAVIPLSDVDINDPQQKNQELLKRCKNLLKGVLERAKERNLFVLLSSTAYSVPSNTLLQIWSKEAAKDEDNDVKCNVYLKGYNKRINYFKDTLKLFPDSFKGIVLQDEPTLIQLTKRYSPKPNELSLGDFDKKEGAYYCVSNRYNLVKAMLGTDINLNKKVIMVNLVGMQSEAFMDGTPYETYVDEFSDIMGNGQKPYLWSYDLYPITEYNYLLSQNRYMINGEGERPTLSDNGEVSINYEQFYTDLVLFNKKTAANSSTLVRESIFWTYLQSQSYIGKYNLRPLALEQYLRFIIFSSLAMGCQGIIYWTYHQRNNQTWELYLSALLDRDGNKTAVWYYARKVNGEVSKYNTVFRYSILKQWGHVGEIYPKCQLMKFPCECLNNITAEGKGVLVSLLENGNIQYLVIVSHDVRDYQNIKLFFSSGKVISELTNTDPATGQPNTNVSIPSGLNRTLPPGGYLIFRFYK